MAMQPTTAAEARDHDKDKDKAKQQIVMVDLGKRQSPKQVRRLREGRGKLIEHIEEIVEDLVEAGTVKASAQPVVIIVRETPPVPWPFDAADFNDDDEDDHDDDDD
jgi:hypothetical protein